MSKERLYFIDNLRIFLISLVVLHHLSITYGAPGGWYYNESQSDFPAIIPLSMFVATNQAFFMGMFFFIAALFTVPSLNRKGTKRFISDRLIRLGIPTVVFYFLISPLTVFIHGRFIDHQNISFTEFLQNGWGQGFGPMWFVEALLIFTAGYLMIRSFGNQIKMKFPCPGKILLMAFLIGVAQYIIRIWLPVGWSFARTNLQFPHFIQYIVLFVFGTIAWQNNWMDRINSKHGWKWFIFSQALLFLGFPLLFYFGGAAEEGLEKFMGGFTWQCFAYTVWEQIIGFSMIMALFAIFKKKFNTQGGFARHLSGSAYAVYIFHAPVLLAISALFKDWQIAPFLKFVVLAPVALIVNFLLAWLVKQIPGVKRVL